MSFRVLFYKNVTTTVAYSEGMIKDHTDLFDAPDDTDLGDLSNWRLTTSGLSKGKIKSNKLGVTISGTPAYYVNIAFAQNSAKYAEAVLYTVASQQGFICPAGYDDNCFVGTTYIVSSGKLRASKKVNSTTTMLGEVTATVVVGDRVGGMCYGGYYYITHNGSIVGGPYTI
jgi:hypothetical protein